jgi:molybdate transport system substrate-binding protein
MKVRSIVLKAAFILVNILFFAGIAAATDITVMTSGGFSAALKELAPQYERTTGNKIVLVFGPSMGTTPGAIPSRIQRGEPADVVVIVDYALDDLVKKGQVSTGTIGLARSGISMAVRAGAPKPDISSAEAFKHTLLQAKSIAYSDSASGVYLSTELFKNLGIADQIKSKCKMIPAEPVGAVVARGDAEIGFQQMSELRPIPGIDIVGPLPPTLQKFTVFSAGVVANSKAPEAAKAFIKFLASPAAAPIITKTGMEPMNLAK